MNTDYAIKEWQQVTFGNRFMFRLVMEKPELCKSLLELVLDMKITKFEYLEPEKSLEAKLSSKGVRLDVYIEDDKGVAYDLEMQATDVDKTALGKRTRYYQSMLDANALKKGAIYNTLPRSYVIFICTFDPFGLKLPRYTFSNCCHENMQLELNDESTKLFINTVGDKKRISRGLNNLMEYINTGVAQDEFTAKLNNEVQTLREDSTKAEMYIMWQQHDLEEQAKGEAKERKLQEEKRDQSIIKLFAKLSDEDILEAFPDITAEYLAQLHARTQ